MHDCEGEVAEAVEDDDDEDGEPEFPGFDVVFVEVAWEGFLGWLRDGG